LSGVVEPREGFKPEQMDSGPPGFFGLENVDIFHEIFEEFGATY
jgi:hypothetical protein